MVANSANSVWIRPNNQQEQVAYIVFEYMQSGDLFDLVMLGGFPEPICRYFFR